MKQIERRIVGTSVKVEARDGARQPVVRGYAAVYDTEAVIAGMFRERIAPGAFRSVIGPTADVRALFNHDDNIVLGRTTNQTLRLSEDERGLAYEFDPNPNDPEAMSVLAKIQRGDVDKSSYGFRVKADEWTKPARAGELPLRTITEFDLLRDVSPVTFPAFDETTAEARSAAWASRAMASGLTADQGVEAAELIQYSAMLSMLDQMAAPVAEARAAVAGLVADHTSDPASGTDEEAAEESIEDAQLAVVLAKVEQLHGLLHGVQRLACQCLELNEDEEEGNDIAMWRSKLDVLELE